jgi:Ca-activated chloride channel family protein
VEQSAGETYAHTPENGLMDARQDAMSTFSLDVDTASYTLARSDLTAGRLPRPEGVRVEEWINFFRYDEPAPSGSDAPFSVRVESAPSYFGQGRHLLRVAVRAQEIPAAQRPAANIVFLVDVSGSMSAANKLPLVQYALTQLVHSLRPDDTIGIVVYAGRQATLLEPTPVSRRGEVLAAIESLRSGGSTNGEGGIRAAYDLAAQHFRRGGINRVVLCTDGDFNIGLTGNSLIRLIERYRDRDITLTTLGFGRGNYNDRDMERLADHGNGNYAYVDNRNEALRVLARDLSGTLQVVAKDVKVQVEFDPEVVSRFRLVGYDNRVLRHRDFEDDSIDAAEIGSGQYVTALLEYELRRGVDPRQDPRALAEVRVRYKMPHGRRSHLMRQTFHVRQARARFGQASDAFRFSAAVAEFAEILRHSNHSEGARFEDVRRVIRRTHFGRTPDGRELSELVTRAERIWR